VIPEPATPAPATCTSLIRPSATGQSTVILARQVIEDFAGRVIKRTGDGILATFDGAARGVRAAREISAGVHSRDLRIRARLHTGETELAPDDVAGIDVHIDSRGAAWRSPARTRSS
jgi:ribulose 1,5-bisphosphate carboxylase large subunit-like protein